MSKKFTTGEYVRFVSTTYSAPFNGPRFSQTTEYQVDRFGYVEDETKAAWRVENSVCKFESAKPPPSSSEVVEYLRKTRDPMLHRAADLIADEYL